MSFPGIFYNHKLGSILAGVLWFVGCSGNSNLFRNISTTEEISTFDSLLESARVAYDRREIDKAVEYIETAIDENPSSSSANILGGYIYLAKIGMEPISLAEGLLKKDSTSSTSTSTSTSTDAGTSASSSSGGGLSGTSILSLGLSDEEVLALGDYDTAQADAPLLVPKCSEEVRESSEKLKYLNKALTQICVFVESDVLNEDDYRHRISCEKKGTYADDEKTQIYFLWSLIHMIEAGIFQSVLSYGSSDQVGATSNFEKRVNSLKTLDTTDPSKLEAVITQIDSMEKIIDRMFPLSSSCVQSQFNGILLDLYSTAAGFAKMPGLPESISQKITKTLDKIKSYQDGLSQSVKDSEVPSSSRLRALKNQFSEKAAKQVADLITGLEQSGQAISAEQKQKLCSSLDSMGGGNTAIAKPTLCL